jgi:hypothetical protein
VIRVAKTAMIFKHVYYKTCESRTLKRECCLEKQSTDVLKQILEITMQLHSWCMDARCYNKPAENLMTMNKDIVQQPKCKEIYIERKESKIQ